MDESTSHAYGLADLPEFLRSRIAVNPATGCWEWQGRIGIGGYGHVRYCGRTQRAHIVAWVLLVGPVPEGLELDHVRDRGCRSNACCNPAHLEPVTHAENMARMRAANGWDTHCRNGHELTPDNIAIYRGWRCCKQCAKASRQRRAARRRGTEASREFYRQRYWRRKQQRLERQNEQNEQE